jgi:hypothetical protein
MNVGLALRRLAVEGATMSFSSSSSSSSASKRGELEDPPLRVGSRLLTAEEATGSSESLETIGGLAAFRFSARRGGESSSGTSLLSVSFCGNANACCVFLELIVFIFGGFSCFFAFLLFVTSISRGGADCFLSRGWEGVGRFFLGGATVLRLDIISERVFPQMELP